MGNYNYVQSDHANFPLFCYPYASQKITHSLLSSEKSV